MWFDRSGKALGTMGAPDENDLVAPALSPDGRRVVVHRVVQGNTDLWLLDGVRMTRFTSYPGMDRFPLWSPDGSRDCVRLEPEGRSRPLLEAVERRR